MIRVLLADDHALVRTGMRLILGTDADIEVVGEADARPLDVPPPAQAHDRNGPVG